MRGGSSRSWTRSEPSIDWTTTVLLYNPDGAQPRLVVEPGQSVPFLPSFGIRLRF